MTQYFAVAEGWKMKTPIRTLIEWARQDAMDIVKKSGRKSVSIFATNGYEVEFVGSVVPSGSGYKYMIGPSYKSESRAINKDGSLRAKPSPRPFI